MKKIMIEHRSKMQRGFLQYCITVAAIASLLFGIIGVNVVVAQQQGNQQVSKSSLSTSSSSSSSERKVVNENHGSANAISEEDEIISLEEQQAHFPPENRSKSRTSGEGTSHQKQAARKGEDQTKLSEERKKKEDHILAGSSPLSSKIEKAMNEDLSNRESSTSKSTSSSSKRSSTKEPVYTLEEINPDAWEDCQLDFYETPDGEMRVHAHHPTKRIGPDGSGIVVTVPNHFVTLEFFRAKFETLHHLMHLSGEQPDFYIHLWTPLVPIEILYAMGTKHLKPSSQLSSQRERERKPSASQMHPQHLHQNQHEPRTHTHTHGNWKKTLDHETPMAHGGLALAPPVSGGIQHNLRYKQRNSLTNSYGWMRNDVELCKWEGISCGSETLKTKELKKYDLIQFVSTSSITRIDLPYFNLQGTLPTEVALLTNLMIVNFRGNQLSGTIPTEWIQKLTNLVHLDLRDNKFSGTIPREFFTNFKHLRQLWFAGNQFTGTIPISSNNVGEEDDDGHGNEDDNDQNSLPRIEWLDLSMNKLHGTLPSELSSVMGDHLVGLFLEGNQLHGTLPTEFVQLKHLEVIDLGGNAITGTIPKMYGNWLSLRDFNVAGNQITGTIPLQLLKLTNLEVLILGQNQLHGTITSGGRDRKAGYLKWSNLAQLQHLMINDNYFSGTLPKELLIGVRSSLTSIDISYNDFTGTIPIEIASLSSLERIDAMANYFSGTLPAEMNRMNPNLELNFTNNLITGGVPNMFCGGGPNSMNFLYRQFGCDAVLCSAGTFHPAGAATLHSGCKVCPSLSSSNRRKSSKQKKESKVLGRSHCGDNHVRVVNGDVDGDGKVSPREVLRLLFVETIGRFWGTNYQNWIDMNVNECDLAGVTCLNGKIVKLDLVNAAMCTNGERKSGLIPDCRGLPAELGLLTRMEVLTLNRRQFLMGTLPTEIGKLTRLEFLDIGECPHMFGPLPSELGLLTKLKYLNVVGSGFNGTIPSDIFTLESLEKLHLNNNIFSGPIPDTIGQLNKAKEIFISNNYINGTIPSSIGNLSNIENLEFYGNELSGWLPESLSKCTNLKRLDVFSNRISGPIPESLAKIEALQILHLKMNLLTGTIPSLFGTLPYLSWFDLSYNRLYGTIPASFATSPSINDFRLGANMIYDPLPQSLCTNTLLNSGAVSSFGCDGVICPRGTYADTGHATIGDGGCKPCPAGQTTMYLGSPACEEFKPADILSLLFDAMQGDQWPEELRENWKHPQINICYWSGVICDTDGNLVSLGFPVAWDKFLREGVHAPFDWEHPEQ